MTQVCDVLLVEDDPFIQTILLNTLKGNYRISTCKNGIDALSWLEDGHRAAIIITDLFMPVMDGYELIKQVRSSSIFGDTPILVLSGKEDSNTRIQCLQMGADDFVVKPFNPMEIKAKVDAILRRSNLLRI